MTRQVPETVSLGDFVRNMTQDLPFADPNVDPFSLFQRLEIWCCKNDIPSNERCPRFNFSTRVVGRKRRFIGAPNDSARELHKLFRVQIQKACRKHNLGRFLVPKSATAFTCGSSPLKNVFRHRRGQHFYVVDLSNAYGHVDMDLLTLILVGILNYEDHFENFNDFLHMSSFGSVERFVLNDLRSDPLYFRLKKFLDIFCRDPKTQGLITGGPISPFLFNLFYEAVLDCNLRSICGADVVYTRYADDLVFSCVRRPIWSEMRKKIRQAIEVTGGVVNHKKSRVLDCRKGVVFVTGFGVGGHGQIVFPKEKRTKLQGMLRTVLHQPGTIESSVIHGHIAHFREYLGVVEPTSSDQKLLNLIVHFESQFF